ncbi:MAG: ABC transporter substrate-binding protein [Pseudomonadota bacterium]
MSQTACPPFSLRRPWLAGAFLLATLPAHAVHLHLTTESAPPSSILKDGVVIGHATEKIRMMMARAKVTVDIEMLPWQRAYQLALLHPDTCVYDTTRTPEREASFKWIGPIAVTDWNLYGLAARKLQLNTLDQARPYKIGTYLSDATEQFLLNRGFKVESVANDALNPGKLMTQRIDLWAASPIRAAMLMKRAGVGEQIVPVLTFNHVQLWLACNPAVPTTLIEQLSGILQAMQRDGSAKAIDDKYARWPLP